MKTWFALLLPLWGTIFFWSAASRGDKVSVEVYGDSLSAGLFTDFPMTRSIPKQSLDALMSDLYAYKISDDHGYLDPYENKAESWINFLLAEMKPLWSVTRLENFSTSNAKSFALPSQVRQLKGTRTNALAFFFIGHNDLCGNLDDPTYVAAEFKEHYLDALLEWDRKHEDSEAFLIPVAQVYSIFPVLDKAGWKLDTGRKFQCRDSWLKIFPYCASYVRLHDQQKLKKSMEPLITKMATIIDDLSLKLEAKSKTNRFFSMDEVDLTDLQPKHFAIDCYHLSKDGQKGLANKIFLQFLGRA